MIINHDRITDFLIVIIIEGQQQIFALVVIIKTNPRGLIPNGGAVGHRVFTGGGFRIDGDDDRSRIDHHAACQIDSSVHIALAVVMEPETISLNGGLALFGVRVGHQIGTDTIKLFSADIENLFRFQLGSEVTVKVADVDNFVSDAPEIAVNELAAAGFIISIINIFSNRIELVNGYTDNITVVVVADRSIGDDVIIVIVNNTAADRISIDIARQVDVIRFEALIGKRDFARFSRPILVGIEFVLDQFISLTFFREVQVDRECTGSREGLIIQMLAVTIAVNIRSQGHGRSIHRGAFKVEAQGESTAGSINVTGVTCLRVDDQTVGITHFRSTAAEAQLNTAINDGTGSKFEPVGIGSLGGDIHHIIAAEDIAGNTEVEG